MKQHLFVPKPNEGNRYAISDIHGHANSFRALISKINLRKEDQLFLLGDYINRGPDSKGVLDYIFELKQKGFTIFPLIGNHELMALESHKRRLQDPSLESVFGLQKRKGLVDAKRLLLPQYLFFFQSLPYYYELDKYFLVHAGFDFRDENPFEAYAKMPWITKVRPNKALLNDKRIVRGHVTHTRKAIEDSLQEDSLLISIDNGSYKTHEEGKGGLCCLNLDSLALIFQENIG